MPLYTNLDTDHIERIEQEVVTLDERIDSLRVELRGYLAETPRFQHNPPCDVPSNHRRPTLYEYLGTLRLNSLHLSRTLAELRSEIARGSDGVNDN